MGRLSLQDRTTEMLVGVLMAVTFRGAAHAVADHPTLVVLATVSLGGTVAWGLVDAVLSLMQAKGSRLRFAALVASAQAGEAHEPPFEGLAIHLDAAGRRQVAPALAQAAARMDAHSTRLTRDDWLGAGAVLVAVVAAGLPPLVPFLFLDDAETAFHASNAVAGVLLFGIGAAWGRGHGLRPWLAGLGLVVLGAALVVALFLLGG